MSDRDSSSNQSWSLKIQKCFLVTAHLGYLRERAVKQSLFVNAQYTLWYLIKVAVNFLQ